MSRKLNLLVLAACTLALLLPGTNVTLAQGQANAWTTIETNLRSGPGLEFAVLTTLPKDFALIVEGRTNDTGWILVRSQDGSTRGWGKTRLFRLSENLQLRTIAVSNERINATAPAVGAPAAPGAVPPEAPAPKVSGTAPLNMPFVARITPAIRSAMRAVYRRGLERGNNPRAFSKVGDCQTSHWGFLNAFGWGKYDLGRYGNLQEVINYFNVSPREGVGNSWDAASLAASNGFSSSGVLQPEFNDPSRCQPGERPLRCEYRLTRPAVAIIMFGTADVLVMTPNQFYNFMSQIVVDSLDRGIIPVLSTFPENPSVPEKSRQLNQLVLQLARRRSLPVMNLADALKPLPNGGLDADGIHLTLPPDGNSGVFNDESLKYGYTMRNLIVLQTLDAIWRQILN